MFNENDVVELNCELPEFNLKKGDKGTILMVLSNEPPVYEIEFTDEDGETLAVESINAEPLKLFWKYKKQ